MRFREVRECQDPACAGREPHEDDEGTRFLGVPAWAICFAVIVTATIAMLVYTAAQRA